MLICSMMRSRADTRPVVPWLRKMEYMTDFTREKRDREQQPTAGRARTAGSRADADEDVVRQRERIERGFEAAKETPVHRTKPHLTPVSVLPLVPDLQLVQTKYVH